MSAQILSTGADPFYKQTMGLDGTPYSLRFAFNLRAACWYLDLSTLDGELLAAGMKLVCNWDLLRKCKNALRPPGKLFVISNTTDLSPPGLGDLAAGARCLLIYLPLANIRALGGLPP